MKSYYGKGLCYLSRLKAAADNTNHGLNNFSYPTTTEFNNGLFANTPDSVKLHVVRLQGAVLITLRNFHTSS